MVQYTPAPSVDPAVDPASCVLSAGSRLLCTADALSPSRVGFLLNSDPRHNSLLREQDDPFKLLPGASDGKVSIEHNR
jgi:hypothetical protein